METKKKGIIIFLVFLSVLGVLYISQKKNSFANSESDGNNDTLTQKQIDDSVRIQESEQLLADSLLKSSVKNIEFTNSTSKKIYVAIGYGYQKGSNYESHGWINIEPNSKGNISLPKSFDTSRPLYWYAKDEGNLEWVGENNGSNLSFCINSEDFNYVGNKSGWDNERISTDCKNGSKIFKQFYIFDVTTSIVISP